MAKPTVVPEWGRTITPPALDPPEVLNGYLVGASPTADQLNRLQKNYSEWCDYLDGLEADEALTWTQEQTFSGGGLTVAPNADVRHASREIFIPWFRAKQSDSTLLTFPAPGWGFLELEVGDSVLFGLPVVPGAKLTGWSMMVRSGTGGTIVGQLFTIDSSTFSQGITGTNILTSSTTDVTITDNSFEHSIGVDDNVHARIDYSGGSARCRVYGVRVRYERTA